MWGRQIRFPADHKFPWPDTMITTEWKHTQLTTQNNYSGKICFVFCKKENIWYQSIGFRFANQTKLVHRWQYVCGINQLDVLGQHNFVDVENTISENLQHALLRAPEPLNYGRNRLLQFVVKCWTGFFFLFVRSCFCVGGWFVCCCLLKTKISNFISNTWK